MLIKQKFPVKETRSQAVQKLVLCTGTGLLLCFLWLLAGSSAQAQGETAYWYFGGGAGLYFGPFQNGAYPFPQALTNSAMSFTWEACAVASNADGDLLFYTNGVNIWRADGSMMNSTTNTLGGNTSSTQGALVVKKPGSDNIYYVFTAQAVETVPSTSATMPHYYTTVDMSIGGTGAVVTYNTPLNKGGTALQGTEKMQAIQHSNGRDVWVVLHEWHSDIFCAYLVTPSGVNPDPVMSQIGSIHVVNVSGGAIANDKWQASGCMKFSPDGRRLAVTVPGVNLDGTSQSPMTSGTVEIFAFNQATGRVAAPPGGVVRFAPVEPPYGVEFSPDNRLLYLSAATYSAGTARLLQYDLRATDIPASEYTITTGTYRWRGLQLARNGKIYVARIGASSLGVINSPNTTHANCNFVQSGVGLSGGESQYTLPNFVQSFLGDKHPPAVQCDVCDNPSNLGQEIPWGSLENFTAPFDDGAGNVCTMRVYFRKRICGPYQDIKLVAIHRESFGAGCDNSWNGLITDADGSFVSTPEFLIHWAGDELLRNAANYYGLTGSGIAKVRFFRSPLYSGGTNPNCSNQWVIGYDRRDAQLGVTQICCFTMMDLLRCEGADFQVLHTDEYSSTELINIEEDFFRDPAIEGHLPPDCGDPIFSSSWGYRGCSSRYDGFP